MYFKQYKGELLVQKSTGMPKWVKWVHHITGLIHCPECLMLDGCWFLVEKAPIRVLSIRIEKKVNYFYEVTTSD